MGRDEVNSAGLALTIEGINAVGFTLCLGLGMPQATTAAFHDPSPLMTLTQADALWVACDADPVVMATARAAMPIGVRNWFDSLSTSITIGTQIYNLQTRALQAVRISHRPKAPRMSPGGGLATVV